MSPVVSVQVKSGVHEMNNTLTSPGDRKRDEDREGRAARLRQARLAAGFDSAMSAAQHFGWSYTTYASHERGARSIGHDAITRYARALRVPGEWLAYGRGEEDGRSARVRVEGYVLDDGRIELRPAERSDEIPEDAETPPGTTADRWKAYRFVGEHNAPFYHDNDILYIPRDHQEPASNIGEICIVQLADGRLLLRVLSARLGERRYLLTDFALRTIEADIVSAGRIGWTRHSDPDERRR
jgi:hypothetical protein